VLLSELEHKVVVIQDESTLCLSVSLLKEKVNRNCFYAFSFLKEDTL